MTFFQRRLGAALTALAVAAVMLCGCAAVGVDRYESSEKYAAGNFTYEAAAVDTVSLHWCDGTVSVQQTGTSTLSVTESGGGLSEKQQLHWYIEGSVLHIEYAASGYRGAVKADKKALTLEVPRNIFLNITAERAEVTMGSHDLRAVNLRLGSGALHTENLKTDELCVETDSAALDFGTVTADRAVTVSTKSGAVTAKVMYAPQVSVTATAGKTDIQRVNAAESVMLKSESGVIACSGITAEQVTAESKSGAIQIGLAQCKEGTVATTSGDVHLKHSQSLGLTVAYTTKSGHFRSAGYTEKDGAYVFGTGGCHVTVTTASGNLTVK